MSKPFAVGGTHSAVIDENHNVWMFGNNGDGTLGPGKVSNLPPVTAVSIGSSYSLYLDFEGSVWSHGNGIHGASGTTDSRLQKIASMPPMKSIFAGHNTSFFLDHAGNVWCCGYFLNDVPDLNTLWLPQQLPALNRIKFVVSSVQNYIFVNEEGNVWGKGSNSNGNYQNLLLRR